jgi:hypothetical protein
MRLIYNKKKTNMARFSTVIQLSNTPIGESTVFFIYGVNQSFNPVLESLTIYGAFGTE